MTNVAMCIDTKCLKNPSLLGITRKDISGQPWLKLFTNACTFRDYVNSRNNIEEIWVVSSDDIDAINIAATCKCENTKIIVCLITFDLTGSLQSRAKSANIDCVLNIKSFKERFAAKRSSFEAKNMKDKNAVISIDKFNKIPNNSTDSNNNKKAFILSVISASGGAGKSSVSVMSSVLAQARGYKTLLLDGDFQFGEADMLLGSKRSVKIDSLLAEGSDFSKLKTKGNIPCIIGPPKSPELAEKIVEELPQLLKVLKELFDVIVVNTGSFWGELQALLLENDNKSLFLVDQRPSSIHSTRKAIDLCDRCGIAMGSVIFALNKCNKKSLFSSIDVSYALQGLPVAEIMDGGLEVDECLASGNPEELIKNKNPFVVSLWGLLEEVLPQIQNSNSSNAVERELSPKPKRSHRGIFRR